MAEDRCHRAIRRRCRARIEEPADLAAQRRRDGGAHQRSGPAAEADEHHPRGRGPARSPDQRHFGRIAARCGVVAREFRSGRLRTDAGGADRSHARPLPRSIGLSSRGHRRQAGSDGQRHRGSTGSGFSQPDRQCTVVSVRPAEPITLKARRGKRNGGSSSSSTKAREFRRDARATSFSASTRSVRRSRNSACIPVWGLAFPSRSSKRTAAPWSPRTAAGRTAASSAPASSSPSLPDYPSRRRPPAVIDSCARQLHVGAPWSVCAEPALRSRDPACCCAARRGAASRIWRCG